MTPEYIAARITNFEATLNRFTNLIGEQTRFIEEVKSFRHEFLESNKSHNSSIENIDITLKLLSTNLQAIIKKQVKDVADLKNESMSLSQIKEAFKSFEDRFVRVEEIIKKTINDSATHSFAVDIENQVKYAKLKIDVLSSENKILNDLIQQSKIDTKNSVESLIKIGNEAIPMVAEKHAREFERHLYQASEKSSKDVEDVRSLTIKLQRELTARLDDLQRKLDAPYEEKKPESINDSVSKKIDSYALDVNNNNLKIDNASLQIKTIEKKIENIYLLLKKLELSKA